MTKTSRTVSYSLLASAFLGGLLLGAVMAAHPGGTHFPTMGRTNAPVWNPYRPGTPPKELMIIFAVDKDGEVQANYRNFGPNPGKPAMGEDFVDPTVKIEVKIGNPKVCWTTSSGDKECVVYG